MSGMEKAKTLEDLKGGFVYGWAMAGAVDVIAGVLGTYRFMEGADLNNGQTQLALIGIGVACSAVAFFCGARFRADKNRAELVDDAQALVDTYKAAAEKSEREAWDRVAEKEHELQDRVAEKEHELQDLNAAHHDELDGLRHRINELTTQLEAERGRAAKAADLQRALDAKVKEADEASARADRNQAALEEEKRKSAELSKRWDDLHAGERRMREAELRARRNFDADRLLKLTPRECVAIDKILRAKDGVECLQDGTDVEALIESHIIYEAENVSFDGMFYVGVEGTRMCAIERAELPYFSRYAQQVAEVAREYSVEALVRVADQIRRGIPGVEPLGDTRRTGETDHAEELAG